eukprot:11205955-Lingulodinium_polyedra.AAC.1
MNIKSNHLAGLLVRCFQCSGAHPSSPTAVPCAWPDRAVNSSASHSGNRNSFAWSTASPTWP